MTMSKDRRHKNARWLLPPSDERGNVTEATVTNALLMDIRDELQQLNLTLGCYRVQRMSDDIHRIDRRLQNKLPLGRKKS